MKIEILYFDGCPNHRPAVDRVKAILAELGLEAEISEIKVDDTTTAQSVGFLGSPTVRIDGLDIEPAARASREFGMKCRIYSEGRKNEGVPSSELIRSALEEAAGRSLGSSNAPGREEPTAVVRKCC